MSFPVQSLYLKVLPSRLYGSIVFLAHFLALSALYFNSMFEEWLVLALMFGVLVSLIEMMHRSVLLLHPDSVTEVFFNAGGWRLMLRSGEQKDAVLLRPVFAGQDFIVLRFRMSHWKTMSVVMAADACAADTYRRSRVFLNFSQTKAV